jgi:hypothetical protein
MIHTASHYDFLVNQLRRIVQVLLLLCAVSFVLASKSAMPSFGGLYIGVIGGQAVVAKLGTDGSNIRGSYYYRRYALDIPLEGTVSKTGIELTEHTQYGGDATWQAKLEHGELVGEFSNDKTTLPLRLRPVREADFNHPGFKSGLLKAWRSSRPYDYLKFDLPLKASAIKRYGSTRIQWLTEPKSQLRFPRLLGHNTTRINQALERQQLSTALEAFECAGYGGGPGFGAWEQRIEIGLLTQRVLSLNIHAWVYCGGAHPEGFPDSLTLDLQTGTKLRLEDLWRVVKIPASLDLKTENDAYFAYLKTRGTALRQLAIKANPQLNDETSSDTAGCYFSDEEFVYAGWYLTPKGLVLQYDFPHANDVCESVEEPVIPYKFLKPYRTPGSRI